MLNLANSQKPNRERNLNESGLGRSRFGQHLSGNSRLDDETVTTVVATTTTTTTTAATTKHGNLPDQSNNDLHET